MAGADTLDFYGHLTGKTILASPALPRLPDSIIADLPDDTNAIPRLEKALAEQGLEVVYDGPHFVRLFPKGARNSLTNAPLRGAELAASPGKEVLGPGMIDFRQADLNQVLQIYSVLSQRSVLRSITLPAPTVSLKSQCPLSKEEARYAMATVLALNGIRLVDDGSKFVQVVPMVQRDQVKTAAPIPEPGEKTFDPKKVPSMGGPNSRTFPPPPSKSLTDLERVEREWERLRQAFYDFMHPSDPTKPAGRRLFELYARLADKTAVPSPKFDGIGVWFRIETPVTKAELLYAIETTFTLNNLAIIPVGDDKIRLGHISEAPNKARP